MIGSLKLLLLLLASHLLLLVFAVVLRPLSHALLVDFFIETDVLIIQFWHSRWLSDYRLLLDGFLGLTHQLFQLAVFLFNRLAQVFYQSMLSAIFAGWRIQLFVTKVEFLF